MQLFKSWAGLYQTTEMFRIYRLKTTARITLFSLILLPENRRIACSVKRLVFSSSSSSPFVQSVQWFSHSKVLLIFPNNIIQPDPLLHQNISGNELHDLCHLTYKINGHDGHIRVPCQAKSQRDIDNPKT